jgi:5-(carboxyamino)imidazole ribonucleotide synthase
MGGGQLGKMLLLILGNLTYKPRFGSSDGNAAKLPVINSSRDLMDFDTVYNFGKKVDVLTFEVELVNLEALVKLEMKVEVYPSQKH